MAGTPGTYIVLGHEADVKINDTLFGVTNGSVRVTSDQQEGGDTNTGGVKIHKGGRAAMSANLDFVAKSDQNPFGAPFSMAPGSYVRIKVYPQGVTVNVPCETDYFLISEGEYSFNVDGKGQGRISGISSGSFNFMGVSYT